MAQAIVGTTDYYTRAACNANGYAVGIYPNLLLHIDYNFQIGFTGQGGSWYQNNYRFGFHQDVHYVNLNISGGGGYWSPAMAAGAIVLGWGNGESCYHVPGFSGSGYFSFSGNIGIGASLARPTSYQIRQGSITNVSQFSATLGTIISPNAGGYYVGKIYDTLTGKTYGEYFNNNLNLNITGLTPNTTYKMSVRVYDRNYNLLLNGKNAEAGTFTTLSDQQKVWMKINGEWIKVKLWIKINGEWKKVKNLYIKINGEWKKIKNLS